jgi:hypothetical protein
MTSDARAEAKTRALTLLDLKIQLASAEAEAASLLDVQNYITRLREHAVLRVRDFNRQLQTLCTYSSDKSGE